MAALKKSFVVYFDSYPLLTALSMEQRGLLFSILMVYADRSWRDPSVSLEEVIEGFPPLAPETRMACGFMGAAIQRDTEAWISKQEYRQKKRQDQRTPAAGADQRVREDIQRTRRLMEQLQRE